MAYIDVICPLLQKDMESLVGRNAATLNRQPTGLLDAIRSDINTSGLDPIPLDTGDGKRKRVQIYYTTSTPVADLVTSPADHCNSQTAQEPEEEIVEIDHFIGSPGRVLTVEQMKTLCAPGLESDALRRSYLLQDIRALQIAINRDAWAYLAANFGNHFSTGTNAAVSVNLFNGSTVDMFGWTDVTEGYQDNEGLGYPMVIGAGLTSRFFKSLSWGCCNDGGIDLNRANGEAYFFRDKDTAVGLGSADEFAVLSPGAFHFVQFMENAGEFMDSGDTFAHTRIIDPITGIEFDVNIVYNACNRTWTWEVGASYTFWIMPNQWSEAPGVGSMGGVNGSMRFAATQTP